MPGPNPTFAQVFTQVGYLVKFWNELEKFGNSNSANVVDIEDTLTTALDGVFTPNALPLFRQLAREPLAGVLDPPNLRRMLYPFLQEFARVIGIPELGPGGRVQEDVALRRLRQYMVDNSQTLNSRGMTLDTTASGSTTGTGNVYRLTVDKDGKTLECTGAETKVLTCDQDQNTGRRKHDELFEFKGGDAELDGLYWTGSGRRLTIPSLHCRSGGLLVNPSFDQGAAADDTVLTSTTQLTGWSIGTAANLKTQTTTVAPFRGYPGGPTTQYCVQFLASDTLTQVLKSANSGAVLDPRRPYISGLAWMRKGSATGTLTFHVGSKSVAVDISTGTNDAWNWLSMDVGTKLWPDNFNEGDLDIKVDVATLAVGTVVVDDVVLAPMEMLDGTWWAVVGGATPWLRGDALTFSGDADGGTRAILSYWLWRAYGDDFALLREMRGWFPTDNAAGETVADPS